MSYSLTYTQAILVLVFVADKLRQGLHDFVPTRAIASSLGIPAATTAKILHGLGLAGLIETREGAKGERPTRAQQAIRKALAGAEAGMRAHLAESTIDDILAQFGAARAEP